MLSTTADTAAAITMRWRREKERCIWVSLVSGRASPAAVLMGSGGIDLGEEGCGLDARDGIAAVATVHLLKTNAQPSAVIEPILAISIDAAAQSMPNKMLADLIGKPIRCLAR